MPKRPFDKLDSAKGTGVLVKLKAHGDQEQGATVSGTLKAFDSHLNMWLEDAELENDDSKAKYGKLLIRGDSVMVVSPE